MTRKDRYNSDPEYRARVLAQVATRRALLVADPVAHEAWKARRRKGPRQYPPLPTEKACTQCKETKPATTEFFSPRKAGRLGLHSWCRECIAKWHINKKETDPEFRKRQIAAVIAAAKKRLERDPEGERAKINRRATALKRAYRADPVKKAQMQAADRAWIEANREQWRKTKLISEQRRRARKEQVANTATTEQIQALLDAAKVCPDCKKRYNQRRTRSLDHVIPIAAGGAHTIDNLRVICRPCNSAKGARAFTSSGQGVLL